MQRMEVQQRVAAALLYQQVAAASLVLGQQQCGANHQAAPTAAMPLVQAQPPVQLVPSQPVAAAQPLVKRPSLLRLAGRAASAPAEQQRGGHAPLAAGWAASGLRQQQHLQQTHQHPSEQLALQGRLLFPQPTITTGQRPAFSGASA